MKVREVIDKLKSLDPDLDIVGYTEDEDLLVPGHHFRLLYIESITVTEAEQTCTDDEVPTFRIGKTADSKRHVVIEMISTF